MKRRASVASALVAVGIVPLLAGATVDAQQVYSAVWMTPVIDAEPCLLSIALPPSEADRCIAWTRREASGAAFDRPTGLVLTGGSDKQLHAIDATNGEKRYEVKLPGALVARPIVVDDGAYFGTDDAHVLRTDVATGRIRWDAMVDAEVIEPVSIDDDLLVVITGLDSVYAFKRSTGEPLWVQKHALPRGITLRGQARPLVATTQTSDGPQRRIYVGHASGRLSILDAASGRVIDELSVSADEPLGDLDADPFLDAGHLVVASQTKGIVAYDVTTNAELWRNNEPGIVRLARGGPDVTVAAGAGKVLGLDSATGKVRWRFTFERGAPTRIAVTGGRVHVASDRGSLFILDLFSGRPLQTYGSGEGFAADLEVDRDMLFTMTTSGRLHALSNAFDGVLQTRSLQRKK